MQQIQKPAKLIASLMPKFEHQTPFKGHCMKSVLKPILLAGFLATTGLVAFSQTPTVIDHCPMLSTGTPMHEGWMNERPGKINPARMQARIQKRTAEFKTGLKLSADQEGAWTAFTTAMKPSSDITAKHPDFTELAKLPTPERIDKMKVFHTQRLSEISAAMDKRAEATKAFYAVLTPEQQKVFDTSTSRHHGFAGRSGFHHNSKGTAQPKQ